MDCNVLSRGKGEKLLPACFSTLRASSEFWHDFHPLASERFVGIKGHVPYS